METLKESSQVFNYLAVAAKI